MFSELVEGMNCNSHCDCRGYSIKGKKCTFHCSVNSIQLIYTINYTYMWDTPNSIVPQSQKTLCRVICRLLDKEQVRIDLNHDNYTILLFISPNFVYSMYSSITSCLVLIIKHQLSVFDNNYNQKIKKFKTIKVKNTNQSHISKTKSMSQ